MEPFYTIHWNQCFTVFAEIIPILQHFSDAEYFQDMNGCFLAHGKLVIARRKEILPGKESLDGHGNAPFDNHIGRQLGLRQPFPYENGFAGRPRPAKSWLARI